MAIDRELLRAIRRLDEYDLRRLLIVVRGLLLQADGPPEGGEVGLPPTLTYRQESVRCGKSTCNSCPHGPYWYAYWREDGRTRKRYIGRQLPGEELEPVVPTGSADRDGPVPPGDRPGARAGDRPGQRPGDAHAGRPRP